MLVDMEPNLAPARAADDRLLAAVTSITIMQQETLKRLTRMETRVVNLMRAHNLDRDGQPQRCGGTV